MGELRKLEPVSDWLEYDLETKQLDPPVLRLRLNFITNPADYMPSEANPFSPAEMLEKLLALVADWDVTSNGVPIPLSEKEGRDQLTDFLVRRVPSRGVLLGVAITFDAQNRENFLKNLPTSSPGTTE